MQDLLEPLLPARPVRRRPLVAGQPRPARVFPDRGVQHRDRLGERDRHVGVGGGLAGRLRRLPLQLDQPLGRGVRLGGQQPRQVIGELRVAAARPAELLPRPRVELPVDRVIRLALDDLAGGEAQRFCSRAPPPARRLPGLGGVDVVAAGGPLGARPGPGSSTRSRGRSPSRRSRPRPPAASLHDHPAAELTMII